MVVEAPQDWVEKTCGRLLGRSVRVDRGFFEQGGDSLALLRLAGRIREEFGASIPLSELFEASTIGDIAQRILERTPGEPRGASSDDVHLILDRPYPLVPAQRYWARVNLQRQQRGWPAFPMNIATATLLEGSFEPALLRRALKILSQRHEALRTSFPDGYASEYQIFSREIEPELLEYDFSRLSPAEAMARAIDTSAELSTRVWDSLTAPLWGVLLVKLDSARHILSVSMWHLISDGWSFALFMNELGLIYDALADGTEPTLPTVAGAWAKTVAARPFEVSAEQADDLADRLPDGGGVRHVDLPGAHPLPVSPTFAGASASVTLDARKIRRLCEEAGVSLHNGVLAILGLLAFSVTAEEVQSVRCSTARRLSPADERVFGYFGNAVVILVDVRGAPTFRRLLKRVGEAAVQAWAIEPLDLFGILRHCDPDAYDDVSDRWFLEFNYDAPVPGWSEIPTFTGVRSSGVELPTRPVTNMYEFEAHERGDSIVLDFYYTLDEFMPVAADQMMSSLGWIYELVCEHPDIAISQKIVTG
jgi:acyl carrier protein